MMIDYSTCTQDDVDDGPFTEFNEGFVAYMFGHEAYENPYNWTDGHDMHSEEYFVWQRGWHSAQEFYPDLPRRSFQ